jgi:hypothetical protein
MPADSSPDASSSPRLAEPRTGGRQRARRNPVNSSRPGTAERIVCVLWNRSAAALASEVQSGPAACVAASALASVAGDAPPSASLPRPSASGSLRAGAAASPPASLASLQLVRGARPKLGSAPGTTQLSKDALRSVSTLVSPRPALGLSGEEERLRCRSSGVLARGAAAVSAALVAPVASPRRAATSAAATSSDASSEDARGVGGELERARRRKRGAARARRRWPERRRARGLPSSSLLESPQGKSLSERLRLVPAHRPRGG